MTHPANTPHGHDHGGAFGFARDGYHRAEVHALTASDIESAKVYDRTDNSIGSITDLKVGPDGKITQAVIDVGGFLGMGAHSVQLPFGQLAVLRKTDGDDVRVHLDATKDQLKAMPHHDAK
ncbi:PRC-barrel domain-containing protein [Hyphomonadaceae bacterium BL14]|nr:PRC-barrel domain-containing protein [Hyphomonadaceae bacterium BL14]